MNPIDRLIDEIIRREGGFVDHPSDRGGPTKYGITQATLSQWRGRPVTRQEVMDLGEPEARAIYFHRFWVRPRFDQVAERSQLIADELADTGVNMGPAVAATWFQRWLTSFNRQGSDYPDLLPDGFIGPVTLSALEAFLSRRGKQGELVLFMALNCSQGHRYLELAEGRPANEDFLYGWVLHRVKLQIAEQLRGGRGVAGSLG